MEGSRLDQLSMAVLSDSSILCLWLIAALEKNLPACHVKTTKKISIADHNNLNSPSWRTS